MLLAYLASGATPSQVEAARRVGCSERSARRHLRAMEHDGLVAVETDAAGFKRYRLKPEHWPLTTTVDLPEREVEALTVAILAARDLLAPTPFAEPLARAHQQLERAWIAKAMNFEPQDEAARWHFDGGAAPPFDPACFGALLEAVRNMRPVDVDYYTASRAALSQGRQLHPLGFLVRSGAWCLVAYDPGVGDYRDFALAGFRGVTVVEDETFMPPAGFDLSMYGRDRFGALADGNPQEVRLWVSPEAVPYFRRKLYNPTQQIEAEEADGSATVSFDVEGLPSVVSWVCSWGPKVRVLAPPELVKAVAAAHRSAAGRYDESDP
ncbi:MAG: WYL domain-containing protein [Bacteroidota bacterium]